MTRPDPFVQSRAIRVVAVAGLLAFALSLSLPYFHGNYPLDLHVYLNAGHAMASGTPLYDRSLEVSGYGFTYPPFAATPFALLSLLPLGVATAVVIAFFYLCLAVVVRCSAVSRADEPRLSWRLIGACAVCLAAQPTWATLQDGQVNMLLAALVLADLTRPDGARWRGIATGIAGAVKLTPLIFILYLVVVRDRRAAANAIIGFVTVTAASAAIFPDYSRQFWLHSLADTSRVGDAARVSNQSLNGLVLRAVGAGGGHTVLWPLLTLGVLAGGLYLCRRLAATGRGRLALATVGFLGCLASPITWTHHWVWIVPALLSWREWPAAGTRQARVVWFGLAAVFCYGATRSGPLVSWPVLGPIFSSLFVVAALVAMLSWWVLLRRAAPAEAAPRPAPVSTT